MKRIAMSNSSRKLLREWTPPGAMLVGTAAQNRVIFLQFSRVSLDSVASTKETQYEAASSVHGFPSYCRRSAAMRECFYYDIIVIGSKPLS